MRTAHQKEREEKAKQSKKAAKEEERKAAEKKAARAARFRGRLQRGQDQAKNCAAPSTANEVASGVAIALKEPFTDAAL